MTDSESQRPVLWLIDENEHELSTYQARLQEMLGDAVEVISVMARGTQSSYLDLLSDPRTACIVIDQRLKGSGVADHQGIELAQYLRAVDHKLPIYMLTNFKDVEAEFTGGEWSVEDILSKSKAKDPSWRTIEAARILRRIATFRDILDARGERLQFLIRKGLESDLALAELEELEQLQIDRASPALVAELGQLQQLQQILDEHRKLMETLDNLTKPSDVDAQ